MALTKLTTVWVDAKGQKAAVRFFTTSDSAAHYANYVGATIPLLAALTNAAFAGSPGSIGEVGSPGGLGTADDYQDITLKAVLVYVDSKGNIHRLGIPSPKRSIFLADGVTVDDANTDVVAWNTNLIVGTAGPTAASDRDENRYVQYAGGILQKRPQRRRVNIFTRNPQETGPDE